ncbi:hypothetical protein [Marinibacterium sp. SX1]|uniref:hypothetical protein n=1 Tax=Marinibacterium sp. SX1 TaxID=3388424 RepID=UPI003D164D73
MTEKYLWAGGAAVAGLVIGLAMSGGSGNEAAVSRQMDEMRAELADAVAAVSGKVDELSGGLAANEASVAALSTGLTGQSDSLADLGARAEANAAALDGLNGVLEALSGDQAALGERVSGMTGDMGEMRGELMAAMKDTLAAAAAVGMTGGSGGGASNAGATPAAAPAPEAASEPAPEPETQTAEAPASEPADDSARMAELQAQVGDDGLVLAVGQAVAVGDRQVFLSRLSDQGAHLRIRGQEPILAAMGGAPAELGGNCTIRLAGIAGGRAYMTGACAEEAAEAVADVPPVEVPDTAELALATGQTGLFGDYRVFLSRLDAGTAHLRIFTLTGLSESATVAAHQPHMFGPGCGIALAGIDGRTARLQAACGDAAGGLSDLRAAVAEPAAEPQAEAAAAPATPAPAADTPEPVEAATPAPRLADGLSADGLELRVGETAIVGDVRLFVQRLPGDAVQLMQVGQGTVTLDRFRPLDLGNGCALSLTGVQDGAAYVEPTCAE